MAANERRGLEDKNPCAKTTTLVAKRDAEDLDRLAWQDRPESSHGARGRWDWTDRASPCGSDLRRVDIHSDFSKAISASCAKWLRKETNARIELLQEPLTRPMSFGEIYEAAVRGIERAL